MLTSIHPKLPMRDKSITRQFYVDRLGFLDVGKEDYPDYLMVKKDEVEIHFFLFRDLNSLENYGQVYMRVRDIEDWYEECISQNLPMPLLGKLQNKPWGQKEFSLLDPDHNLLTFGESLSTVN
jgi:catechol 2,3-dioxygenase-like lactoylglutathione lyase family enzyme